MALNPYAAEWPTATQQPRSADTPAAAADGIAQPPPDPWWTGSDPWQRQAGRTAPAQPPAELKPKKAPKQAGPRADSDGFTQVVSMAL